MTKVTELLKASLTQEKNPFCERPQYSAHQIIRRKYFLRSIAASMLGPIILIGGCVRFPETMKASNREGKIFIVSPKNYSAVNLGWTNGNILRTYLFPRPIPYSIAAGVAEGLRNKISTALKREEARYILEFQEEHISAFFRFTDNPLNYSIKVVIKDQNGRQVAESACRGSTSFGRMGIDEFFANPMVLEKPMKVLIDECTAKIANEIG